MYGKQTVSRSVVIAAVLVTATARAGEPRAEELAEQLHAAYRGIQQYHAVWIASLMEDAPDQRIELQVAFDRPARRVLYRLQGLRREGEAWKPSAEGILLVCDGERITKALSFEQDRPWQKVQAEQPENLSYWQVRRALFAYLPIDLPLLMSDRPYLEWLQGEVGQMEALPPVEGQLPGLRVTSAFDETTVVARFDPKTRIIQSAEFGPVTYQLKSIEIDQPLDEAIFDADAHLAALGVKVEEVRE